MQASLGAQRTRAVIATAIGNALEWFDFVIFGFMAPTMAKVFFPTAGESVALLLAFATFGVTFLIRPLGAIVVGAYADRRGRKAALSLTIGLMTVGTAIVAVAPDYASIGILAPVLVVFARALQGLSAGGEFGSATAFLAEQDPCRRGFYASWQSASQGVTTILATGFGVGLTTLLTSDQLEGWGWRIPFVFGALAGPVAYYIRTQLAETSEFQAIVRPSRPLQIVLRNQIGRLLLCVGVTVAATVTTYTMLFMPTYAVRQLGLPASGAFAAGLLTGMLQLLVVPLIGAATDRYGRIPFALVGAFGVLMGAYPLFSSLVIQPTLLTLLCVQALLGLFGAIYVGALGGLISELFPTQTRTTGLSIGNAVAVTVFGGFAPFISASLIEITGNIAAPSFYLMLGAAISALTLLVMQRTEVR
jgi:MFS transporter, MHS family, proline/betaine transporter